MFLDKELKRIQESKDRLATCSEFRRHLVQLDIKGAWNMGRSTFSSLTLGLALAEQILDLYHKYKRNKK